MCKIKEIMTTKVVTVPRKKGLSEVVKLMATTKISSIVITDDDEKIVGIVTERDLIKHILLPGKSIKGMQVDEVMTKEPLSLASDTELEVAAKLMRDKNIRHLPVTDNGKMVGLITQTDIVKETNRIQQENTRFSKYFLWQVLIVILLFVFLGAFVWWRWFRTP
jgi:CBS domain-containing protein